MSSDASTSNSRELIHFNTNIQYAPFDTPASCPWQPQITLTYSGNKLSASGIGLILSSSGVGYVAGPLGFAITAIAGLGKILFDYFSQKKIDNVKYKYKTYQNNFENKLSKLKDINERLAALTLPTCLQDIPEYERRKRALLLEEFNDANNMNVENTMLKWLDATNDAHIKKYGFKDMNETNLKIIHQSIENIQTYVKSIIAICSESVKTCELNALYAEQTIDFPNHLNEFNELYKVILDPKTTDQTRTESQIRLNELKITLDQKLLNLADISHLATIHVQIDIVEIQNNLSIQYDNARFYSQTISDNLLELDRLKNQPRYLDKCVFVQQKLISQNNFEAATNFSKNHINFIPQNANWKDVQVFASLFLQAAQSDANSKHEAVTKGTISKLEETTQNGERSALLINFRESLTQWLQSRPDLTLDVASTAPVIGDNLSGSQAMTLVMGNLYSLQENVGPEAEECFKQCAILMPNDPIWPMNKALCHISANEWSEAKDLLEDIARKATPEQNELIAQIQTKLRQSVALSQYQAGSATADVIGLLTHLVKQFRPKSKTVQIVDSIVQTMTDPIAQNWWLTPLVSYPEDLREILPSPDALSIICFALQTERNFNVINWGLNRWLSSSPNQRVWRNHIITGLSLSTSVVLNASKIYKMWFSKGGPVITYSFSNVAYSAIPLFTIGARCAEGYLGPGLGAVVESAKDIAINTACVYGPVDLLFNKNRAAVTSAGKYLARRKAVATAGKWLGSKLVIQKTLAGGAWICTKVAGVGLFNLMLFGFTVKGVTYDFWKIRAAFTVAEADKLVSQGKYQAAKDLLIEMQQCYGKGISKEYADCIEFIEAIPSLKPNENGQRTLDSLVSTFSKVFLQIKNDDRYVNVFNNLIYYKTIAYLNLKKYEEAKKVLKEENIDPLVNEQVLLFLVNKIQSLSENAAIQFLIEIERVNLFEDNYNTILTKYKEYIICKTAHPILEKNQTSLIEQRMKAIDDVTGLVASKECLEFFYSTLQFEKICVHFDTQKYQEANTLLQGAKIIIQSKLAMYLIQRAENFENPDAACKYLLRVRHLDAFIYKGLINKYKEYIRCCHETFTLTQENIERRIQAINAIVTDIEPIDEFSSLYLKLQSNKCLAFVEIGNYKEASKVLENPKIAHEKSIIVNLCATNLIFKVENLTKEERFDDAKALLNGISREMHIRENKLIERYCEVLSNLKKSSSEVNPQNFINAIRSINNLLITFNNVKVQFPVLLIEQKTKLFINLGSFYQANGDISRARQAFVEARNLLPETGRTPEEHMMIAQIDCLMQQQ